MCAMGFKLQLDYLSLALLAFIIGISLAPHAKKEPQEYTRKVQEQTHQQRKKFALKTHISYSYSRMCSVKTHANKHHNGIWSVQTNKRTNELKRMKKSRKNTTTSNLELFCSVMELFSWIVTSLCRVFSLPSSTSIRFVWSIVIWHLYNVVY